MDCVHKTDKLMQAFCLMWHWIHSWKRKHLFPKRIMESEPLASPVQWTTGRKVIQLFQVFYQGRLMTQAGQRVDVEKLVHWDVDDGACCLGLFVIRPTSSAQFHQPISHRVHGYYQSEEQKMRPWKLAHIFYYIFLKIKMGLPWWLSGKESTCQCRRCRFNLWIRKIHWKKKWQPTRVVWEIPWIEEYRGILSIGLQRVRYDLVTKQQQNQNEIFAYGKNYTYSLKIYGKWE